MLKCFVFTVIVSLVSAGNWAQNKAVHLFDAAIQSEPENLSIFANDNHVVLVGSYDIKPGFPQYTLSSSRLDKQFGKSHKIRTISSTKPNLFGFGFDRNGFSFLEEIYDENEKHCSIYLHTFNPDNHTFGHKVIHKSKSDLKLATWNSVKSPQNGLTVYYSFEQKNAFVYVNYLVFDSEWNVKNEQKVLVKDKLDLSFSSKSQLSEEGDLVIFNMVKNEKEGDVLAYFYQNVFEKEHSSGYQTILKIGKATIKDFKIHMNEESVLEFMALTDDKSQKTSVNTLIFKDIHLKKGVVMRDNSMGLLEKGDLKLNAYLPLDENYAFVVVNTEMNASVESVSKIKNESQTAPKSKLVVYYLHNLKGVIWQKEILSSGFNSKMFPIKTLNKHFFNHCFWSDGYLLYSLYNEPNEKINQVNTSIAVPQINKPADSQYNISISKFDKETGTNKSQVVDMSFKEAKSFFLPGLNKITNPKFLVSVIQTDNNQFYPIQLYFQ